MIKTTDCFRTGDSMPVGFQMDGINFTLDGLKAFPAHAAALGEIVTSFSLIEGVIGGIYGMLRHQTIEQGIESLQALSTNAKRVQAVRNAIAANSLLSVAPTQADLMNQITSYAQQLHKIPRSEQRRVGKEF